MKDGRAKITGKAEASFKMNSFTNWKHGTVKFAKQECSDFHKTSTQALSSTVEVGDMLDKQVSTEKQKREYLMKVCPQRVFFNSMTGSSTSSQWKRT